MLVAPPFTSQKGGKKIVADLQRLGMLNGCRVDSSRDFESERCVMESDVMQPIKSDSRE